jgi:hypothetical protein
LIELTTRSEDRVVATVMAVAGGDVADAAMLMLVVVPAHELGDLRARRLERCEALRRVRGST